MTYRPRSTVRALRQQYRDYGRSAPADRRRHPAPRACATWPRRWRAVGIGRCSGCSPLLGLVAVCRPAWLLAGFLAPVGTPPAARRDVVMGRDCPGGRVLLPAVAVATMHLRGGWGFLHRPAVRTPDAADPPR